MSLVVGDALATLRDRISRFELDWRRTRLPPPTRAHPLPDPEAVRVARTLEDSARRLDRIGGRLRTRPVREIGDDALAAHLAFLLSLTEQESGLADAEQLLLCVRHLETLSGDD